LNDFFKTFRFRKQGLESSNDDQSSLTPETVSKAYHVLFSSFSAKEMEKVVTSESFYSITDEEVRGVVHFFF